MPTASMLSRRRLMLLAAAAVGWGGAEAHAQSETCAKPYAGDQQQREAAHYTEAGPNPRRLCQDCYYFDARGRCGNCRVFATMVNPAGTCDSWSAKG